MLCTNSVIGSLNWKWWKIKFNHNNKKENIWPLIAFYLEHLLVRFFFVLLFSQTNRRNWLNFEKNQNEVGWKQKNRVSCICLGAMHFLFIMMRAKLHDWIIGEQWLCLSLWIRLDEDWVCWCVFSFKLVIVRNVQYKRKKTQLKYNKRN